MSVAITERPSFTRKTERSQELYAAIRALWEDPRVRLRVKLEAWSQIPVGFGLMIGSYLTLVLSRPEGVSAALCLLGIVAGAAAVGGLFHDSGHGATFHAFGLDKRLDRVMAWFVSEVLIGLCAYHWRVKHDYHHSETNILDNDGDLDIEPAFRLHPAKPPAGRIVRYQHWYAWFLYLLMPLPLQVRGHFLALRGGRHGVKEIRPARGWERAGVIAGPPLFYTWTVGIPVWIFGWTALLYFLGLYSVVGGFYGLLFQLAHVMPNVEYSTVGGLREEFKRTGNRKEDVEHQLGSTTDFSPDNIALGYFTASLTNQSGHHAERAYPWPFNRIMTQRVLRPWCAKHNVRYNSYPTLWAAVKAHRDCLRRMGREGRYFEFEMG